MRISVVIPCYCSAESLPLLVPRLLETLRPRGDVEIVLVNDSSPDGGETWDVISTLVDAAPDEIVGIDLARNFGEHHAVLAGLRNSTGDYVVVMDDDGQNPPEEIPKLLDAFDDEIDVVYTSYATKHHHLIRNLGSRFTNWVAGILMGKPRGLYLCSFKGLSRRVVDRISAYPGSFPYIDGLVFRNTRRFTVVAVEHRPREQGASGYNLRRLLRLYANMAFGFSILPLRLVTAVGMSASVLSVFLALWFAIERLTTDSPTQLGWASTAVLITFFGGAMLFALGILGEYTGRLFLSATGQPAYVINEVRRGGQRKAVEAAPDTPIPFVDMAAHFRSVEAPVNEAVKRALESGQYVLGPEVAAFETELADYLGGGSVVGVNSGTDAIALSLIAAGVGPGDEVLTVATTAIPVPSAIQSVGAKPVFFDIDGETWAPDLADLELRLTGQSKAVVVPHLYGKTFDIAPFVAFAREHKLTVIEDAAQSLGATFGDARVGCGGDFGAFSFYPTKPLGAFGDGGAIWVPSSTVAQRLRALRNYGQTGRYEAELALGRNSRLDELQAAILRVKLPGLDEANARRRGLGNELASRLGSLIQLPEPHVGGDHVYHLFVGLLPKNTDREAFLGGMAQQGVMGLVHYPAPLYRQKAFFDDRTSLPVTEDVLRRIVSLPVYPEMSSAGPERIADAVRAVLGSY